MNGTWTPGAAIATAFVIIRSVHLQSRSERKGAGIRLSVRAAHQGAWKAMGGRSVAWCSCYAYVMTFSCSCFVSAFSIA